MKLKTLLSYLFPIRILKTSSKHNPFLELVQFQGNLHLNSKDANYSYGNLQKAFDEVFKQENIGDSSIKSVLILGFGCGSIADTLHKKYLPDCEVVGVEIDSEIIRLYNTYYTKAGSVKVIPLDAMQYLENYPQHFDLVIVDLYQELLVPTQFHSLPFLELVKLKLEPKGSVYFNQVVNNPQSQAIFNSLMLSFSTLFKEVRTHEVQGINRILIAS